MEITKKEIQTKLKILSKTETEIFNNCEINVCNNYVNTCPHNCNKYTNVNICKLYNFIKMKDKHIFLLQSKIKLQNKEINEKNKTIIDLIKSKKWIIYTSGRSTDFLYEVHVDDSVDNLIKQILDK